jgi:hypothetical protein
MKSLPMLALAATLALPVPAGAQDHCTRETLTVRGTPVTIGYCITGGAVVNGPEVALPVAETYSAPGGSFSRSTTMRFIAGDGPSRLLENADLSRIGMTGTLHLTLVYSAGSVHIENALLTPGAVTIK